MREGKGEERETTQARKSIAWDPVRTGSALEAIGATQHPLSPPRRRFAATARADPGGGTESFRERLVSSRRAPADRSIPRDGAKRGRRRSAIARHRSRPTPAPQTLSAESHLASAGPVDRCRTSIERRPPPDPTPRLRCTKTMRTNARTRRDRTKRRVASGGEARMWRGDEKNAENEEKHKKKRGANAVRRLRRGKSSRSSARACTKKTWETAAKVTWNGSRAQDKNAQPGRQMARYSTQATAETTRAPDRVHALGCTENTRIPGAARRAAPESGGRAFGAARVV